MRISASKRLVGSVVALVATSAALTVGAGSVAEAATSCTSGNLWVGFTNPPRYGAYPVQDTPAGSATPHWTSQVAYEANATSIANWNALIGQAGYNPVNVPIHFYLAYVPPGYTDLQEQFWEHEIQLYAAAGYKILVSIHATPSFKQQISDEPAGTLGYVSAVPSQYASFVKGVIDRIGSSLEAVELTNEGDVLGGSGAQSDGSAVPYQGDKAADAPSGTISIDIASDITGGIVAAHDEAAARGDHIKVGFNWAYDYNSPYPLGTTGDGFWNDLTVDATDQVRADLDFMGEHTYPNFLSAATGTYGMTPGEISALNEGRTRMSSIGIPTSTPIRVTEAGYPTDSTATNPGTISLTPFYFATQDDEATYWTLVTNAAQSVAAQDNVTTLYTFLYQQAPSPGVTNGDYGIVLPVNTSKVPGGPNGWLYPPAAGSTGATGTTGIEGSTKAAYPVESNFVYQDDDRSACGYSG